MIQNLKHGLGSDLERAFETYWRVLATDAKEPVREHVFHDDRGWRLDFAWPSRRVAVEMQGGTWTQGRHTRGQGYEDDCEKLAEAQLLGWIVFYVTRGMLERDPQRVIDWVLEAMGEEGSDG